MNNVKDVPFDRLYAGDLDAQRVRRRAIAAKFENEFGRAPELWFSAAGRSELGGNHTDHQNGRVLCATVRADMMAAVSPNSDMVIRLHSSGHKDADVTLPAGDPVKDEAGMSRAIVRGVAAGMAQAGFPVGGFDCYLESQIPAGGGLSSSAAIEVLVAVILSCIYGGGAIEPLQAAKIGQRAENDWFGKPSGLMDQTVCAAGGLVMIDFADTDAPAVTPVDFDFSKSGHSLCLVNTGGSHADLTGDYAAIRAEMRQIAGLFGKNELRGVTCAELLSRTGEARAAVSDRALLRAFHFIGENDRVPGQRDALLDGDFDRFLALVRASGMSSYMYLQNLYSPARPDCQPLPLALAVSERVLRGAGAARVHGGGFAGSIQAFVPYALLSEYVATLNSVFGENACMVTNVRPWGAVRIID